MWWKPSSARATQSDPMEKLEVIRTNRGYAKYYRLSREPVPEEFLAELKALGWTFDRVFLRRDAEMDMQFDIGFYSPEALPRTQGGPPRLFTVTATREGKSGEIRFCDDSDVVLLVTDHPDLEL